jgi:hypothetical protein
VFLIAMPRKQSPTTQLSTMPEEHAEQADYYGNEELGGGKTQVWATRYCFSSTTAHDLHGGCKPKEPANQHVEQPLQLQPAFFDKSLTRSASEHPYAPRPDAARPKAC